MTLTPSDLCTLAHIERACHDLRCGMPISIEHSAGKSLIASAETYLGYTSSIDDLAGATLVLHPARARAIDASYSSDYPALLPLSPFIEEYNKRISDGNQDPHAPLDIQSLLTPYIAASPKAFLSEEAASSLNGNALHPCDTDLFEPYHHALTLLNHAQLLPAFFVFPQSHLKGQGSFTFNLTSNSSKDILAEPHNIPLLSVTTDAIERFKKLQVNNLVRACETPLVLNHVGNAHIVAYRALVGAQEHYAIIVGTPSDTPLVRLHSSCYTGDLLASLSCDCHDQLHHSLHRMKDEGGIILYLVQEGRGIGLINKLRAYALKEEGYDTVDANTSLGFDEDARLFDMAATMLKDLSFSKIRLLSNNPRKKEALEKLDITVTELVPLIIDPNEHNASYLRTKAARLGHQL